MSIPRLDDRLAFLDSLQKAGVDAVYDGGTSKCVVFRVGHLRLEVLAGFLAGNPGARRVARICDVREGASNNRVYRTFPMDYRMRNWIEVLTKDVSEVLSSDGGVPLPEFPGYKVNPESAIVYDPEGKTLSTYTRTNDPGRRPWVSIVKEDGRRTQRMVADLVLEAIGQARTSARDTVFYKNGNPSDPRAQNISWRGVESPPKTDPPTTDEAPFLPIPNFPGYEVNSDGEFRRSDGTPINLMARGDGKSSGLLVQLNIPGLRTQRLAAEMVLTTFGRPRPSRRTRLVFRNGDRTDNRLDNLDWDNTPRTRRPEEGWIRADLLPGYEAHPDGLVRRIGSPKPLRPTINPKVLSGHPHLAVNPPDGRPRRTVLLANIILSTFVGPAANLLSRPVYLDGDHLNCRSQNLQWDDDE